MIFKRKKKNSNSNEDMHALDVNNTSMHPVSSLPRKTRQEILNERFLSGLRVDVSRKDWKNLALVIISWLLYIAAALMISYAVQSMILTENIQRQVAQNLTQATKEWPAPDMKAFYDKAVAYNDSIVSNDVHATGDAVDPTDGKRLEEKDTAYQEALNINNSGAMAVLYIPKISSEMTIYHGTTDDVLTAGVGHIYGSALPIGQKGTTAAISAHSGGVNGLFFTRLPEIGKGDYMYLNVLGQEQGYQIEYVETVMPEELGDRIDYYQKLAKNTNKSLLLASTCFPISINNQRRIVVGVKKSIPHPIPKSETQKDNTLLAATIALIVFIVLMIAAIAYKMLKRHYRIKRELAIPDAEEAARKNAISTSDNTDDNDAINENRMDSSESNDNGSHDKTGSDSNSMNQSDIETAFDNNSDETLMHDESAMNADNNIYADNPFI